jgi:hypothetical protein
MGLLSRLPMSSRLRTALNHYRCRVRHYVRTRWIKTRFGIETVRNWYLDRQFGGSCGGTYASRFEETGAWGTSSVDYYQMPRLFSAANGTAIKPSDVLVDVGCGRGRVINWWLSLGLGNSIYGIELDPQFAQETARRLEHYPNVQIIQGNVMEHIPRDATLFFLFNPFKPPVVAAFKDRLIEVFGERAGITIVYYMCLYKNIFEEDDRWVVEPMRGKTFWAGAIIRMRGAPRGGAVLEANSAKAGALSGSEQR